MKLRRELRLPEAEAQATSLVRAVEEADRAGVLLPHTDRRRATVAARAASPAAASGEATAEDWIGRRALTLLELLEERLRSLPAVRRSTRLGRGLGPLLIFSFALGVATNALGPSRQIQVLAVPLLGLILWNVTLVTLSLVRRWLLRRMLPPSTPAAAAWLTGLVEGLVRRGIERAAPKAGGEHGDPGHAEGVFRRALTAFAGDWIPAVRPLAVARVRRWLHASALLLVAGAVAGMYFRGLVWEYRVTWESTFLSGDAVEWVLTRVLTPAGAVLGIEVPPLPLDQIRGPDRSGDAAPWIHLWAMTAVLFVGLPRALLIAVESRRCRSLSRRLPLDVPEAYQRRLVAAADGAVRRIEVLPYSHRPGAGRFAALKDLMLDLFGPRSDVRLLPTLEYGAEPEPEAEAADAACQVVLFSLAQTPEIEVHGELLEKLRDGLEDGAALVVAVDASAYRRRLGGAIGAADRRVTERRRGWDRVVSEAGLEAVHLDLEEELGDGDLSRVVEAAWPPEVFTGYGLEGPTGPRT